MQNINKSLVPVRNFDPEQIKVLSNYEPVSQEGYDIQPLAADGGKPGILTWGINPCIIIAFHNPEKGSLFCTHPFL